MTNGNNYLVTGGNGFIGAWILKILLERGDRVTTLELSDENHRIDVLLDEDMRDNFEERHGDVSDLDTVRAAVKASRADAIIHLAGLQVPACKADPVSGARVNVIGTLNVFHAAAEAGVGNVTYASSAAVYGHAPADHAVKETEYVAPLTHYGVFKRANEGNALVHWNDNSIPSAGLRPLTVYGLGRDRGLTSAPTTAMKAATLGMELELPLTGPTDFLYVEDAAHAFITCADEIREGAHVFNIAGESTTMEHCIELIDKELPEDRRGLITCEGPEIPIAPRLDDTALRSETSHSMRTSLEEGVGKTMAHFRRLIDEGRLDRSDLPERTQGATR